MCGLMLGKSYKCILMGQNKDFDMEEDSDYQNDEDESMYESGVLEDSSDSDSNEGIEIIDEVMNDKTAIAILKRFKEEEVCIRKLWRKCLIIKLLGKWIGFKLLELKLI